MVAHPDLNREGLGFVIENNSNFHLTRANDKSFVSLVHKATVR